LEVRTTAVRGDGARVDVNREPRKRWIQRDLAFSAGLRQTVYDDVKAVSTTQLSTDEYQRQLLMTADPNSDCVNSVTGKQLDLRPSRVEGHEIRAGIPVVKVLNGSGILVWQAPSLACLALEHFIDWDPAHPGTNTSALKVDSVTQAEPDPSLFAVPADYQEMLPAQARALHLRFGGVPEDHVQTLVAQMSKTDTFYSTHRPAGK